MSDAKFSRLMFRKACSPDNAASEGFFGRLKNELFYPQDRKNATIEQFIEALDSYVRWYNEKRIKIFLGSVWAAAGLIDTDLSFLSFLELYRAGVAERRVTTRRVVEPLDVVEHIGAGLFPGPVHLSGCALGLQ